MKTILAFFFLVFVAFGAGVYFYETQIASPRAADALVKSEKRSQKNKPIKKQIEPRINKPSLPVVKIEDTITKPSRVVDLLVTDKTSHTSAKERMTRHREIEKSIKNTIRKSVSLEIQKAVVTEMSKKR